MKGVFLRNSRLDLCFSFSTQSSRQNQMLLRSLKTVPIQGEMRPWGENWQKRCSGSMSKKICSGSTVPKNVFRVNTVKKCAKGWGCSGLGHIFGALSCWHVTSISHYGMIWGKLKKVNRPFLREERDDPHWWLVMLLKRYWPACHWMCRRWNGSDPLVVEAHRRSPEKMPFHQNDFKIKVLKSWNLV